MNFKTSILALAVHPAHEAVSSEFATHLRIVSEGAGEFVEVSQPGRDGQPVQWAADEWPAVRVAIQQLLDACTKDET